MTILKETIEAAITSGDFFTSESGHGVKVLQAKGTIAETLRENGVSLQDVTSKSASKLGIPAHAIVNLPTFTKALGIEAPSLLRALRFDPSREADRGRVAQWRENFGTSDLITKSAAEGRGIC